MPTKTPVPIMQDLDDPKSLIRQRFSSFSPPEGSFDPDAPWTHIYRDFSSHGRARALGRLSLMHRPGGQLRVENDRICPHGYRSYTYADLNSDNDVLRSPKSWRVETKVAKAADAPAYLNSGMVKKASVVDGVLTLQTGRKRHRIPLPGPTTCKWCLMDAVGRMATRGIKELSFNLLDEVDEVCPKQTLRFTGDATVNTLAGMIEVMTYQHTGIATVPGVFYVDAAGRVLFYLGGMQLLALSEIP